MKHNVIFTGEGGSVRVHSVKELLETNEFVGFESSWLYRRYLVINLEIDHQPLYGVRPGGFWEDPRPTAGKFYVFNSKKELLNWMAEESK